jgi:hypothetical protein
MLLPGMTQKHLQISTIVRRIRTGWNSPGATLRRFIGRTDTIYLDRALRTHIGRSLGYYRRGEDTLFLLSSDNPG